jgi:4-amino-4-deoxy-L-arabinose transferase-like glycosyltransferase
MRSTGGSGKTVIETSLETRAKAWLAHRPKCLSYLIFAVCASLYLVPFTRLLQSGLDEGYFVYDAVRIVHGQIFGRDFIELMGPASFYWLAAFFKLFGVSFLVARISLFLTSLGTALLLYFLSRRVCPRYRMLPCLILAGTGFGALWPGIGHHVDSNFFALLSVACVVLWHDRPRNSLLIAAGALAGITAFTLQTKGVLLLGAILVWFWLRRRRVSSPLFSIGMVTAGFLCVVGFVLLYFQAKGALGALVYAIIVWPYRHYGTVNTVPYAQGIISWYWDRFITMKDAFSWPFNLAAAAAVAILIAPFLFVAALPALVPLSALLAILPGGNKWRIVTPEIGLYGLCGSAWWLSEIHRADIFHLVIGSPLLIVLCIYFWDVNRSRFSGYALQLLAIAALWLAAFNLMGVLTAHSVMTRAGSVAVFKDDPVLAFLDTRVAAGEEIFVYPYHPMYYFLSATTNPTRYNILMYNYNPPAQFQEVVGVLEQRRVRYVVWDTGFEARTADYFPGSHPNSPGDRIIEPYLKSHYRLAEDDHGVWIMERK